MHQEFDPRDLEPALPQPETRARKIKLGPLLLVVAGLAIFGAITWYAYQAGQRQAAVASMPVIKADSGPTRVRPEDPGGMTVPNQDALVLNDPGGTPDRAAGGVEKLLPPPETPLPRPAPTGNQAASNLPPAIGPAPARPAASPAANEPAPPAAAPRSAVEAQPAPPPQAAAASAPATPPAAAAAAPAQTAALPSAAKPPVTVGKGAGGWRVQLAAVKSEQAATAEWARIEKANPELAQLTMTPMRVDLGERGVFYRVQAGPLADAAAAERLCADLKERKQGCLVVKP